MDTMQAQRFHAETARARIWRAGTGRPPLLYALLAADVDHPQQLRVLHPTAQDAAQAGRKDSGEEDLVKGMAEVMKKGDRLVFRLAVTVLGAKFGVLSSRFEVRA